MREADLTRDDADVNGDPYDKLPEGIKLSYTREEYLWLSEAEKASLIQRECDPE